MGRGKDEQAQKSVVPRIIEKCPRCAERTCGRFGRIKAPWFYCYSCLASGSKGWMYHNNSNGMQTQLSIRKYLQQARRAYLDDGFPDSVDRARYGVPGMRWDALHHSLFEGLLFRGSKAGLESVMRDNHGFCRSSSKLLPETERPFLVIEQYPGLVCGVCFLTPDGPVSTYLSTIRRGSATPAIILYMPNSFTGLISVPGGLDKALPVAKEYAAFNLPTCVVADLSEDYGRANKAL